jgi:hypothetical protein
LCVPLVTLFETNLLGDSLEKIVEVSASSIVTLSPLSFRDVPLSVSELQVRKTMVRVVGMPHIESVLQIFLCLVTHFSILAKSPVDVILIVVQTCELVGEFEVALVVNSALALMEDSAVVTDHLLALLASRSQSSIVRLDQMRLGHLVSIVQTLVLDGAFRSDDIQTVVPNSVATDAVQHVNLLYV